MKSAHNVPGAPGRPRLGLATPKGKKPPQLARILDPAPGAVGPRGRGGFGYDPIFVPDGSELTTAQMSPEAKDAISHRGRALRALAPVIAAWLAAAPL